MLIPLCYLYLLALSELEDTIFERLKFCDFSKNHVKEKYAGKNVPIGLTIGTKDFRSCGNSPKK